MVSSAIAVICGYFLGNFVLASKNETLIAELNTKFKCAVAEVLQPTEREMDILEDRMTAVDDDIDEFIERYVFMHKILAGILFGLIAIEIIW